MMPTAMPAALARPDGTASIKHAHNTTRQSCAQCFCTSNQLNTRRAAQHCISRSTVALCSYLAPFSLNYISSRGLRASICSMKSLPQLQNGTSSSIRTPIAQGLDNAAPAFDSIESALDDIARGKFVVVLDDEDRENEGDLIIAADRVTTEDMAFMVEYTSGVICVAMEGADLDRLRLPLMVDSSENEEALRTAFTVTVDLKEGVTTGISASDRANTIRALANPDTQPQHLRRPGHIFPLRCREGGVLTRPGHTEAAVDLSRLAARFPAGVLCEIVNKADGSMARTPDLLKFAREHDLKCITIADLIKYRLNHTALAQP